MDLPRKSYLSIRSALSRDEVNLPHRYKRCKILKDSDTKEQLSDEIIEQMPWLGLTRYPKRSKNK